jgi:cytochrome c oxidase assembly protein subunit 15
MERSLSIWLFIALIIIFIQVIIGGTTRLTESGLSITRWEVVKGSLPPLNEAAWQAQFDLYKQTPQYEKVNKGMTLADFKFIFFWEWLHRVWGRVGFMFLVGVWLLMARKLNRQNHQRFAILLALFAAQGLLGWIMVKSGLVDMPRVSHYRLTAHLLLAIFLFAYILWWIADLLTPAAAKINNTPLKKALYGIIGITVLQIIYGGFMSGLRAAIHYPSFPDMNGYFVPPTLFFMEPFYLNFFENIATVQFMHRLIAYILTALIIWYYVKYKKENITNTYFRKALNLLPFVLLTQVTLGISVLLLSADGTIPVLLGVAHQATGLVLLSTLLFAAFQFKGE